MHQFRICTLAQRSLSSKSVELYFSKRHTCACGAIIFWGLRKRLRRKNFEQLRVRLRRNFYDLRCPPLSTTMQKAAKS